MIVIKSASGTGLVWGTGGMPPVQQEVEIIADTEADITALGKTVTDKNGAKAIPAPGSVAYTADLSVGYMLSPSGVWTKFRG